MFGKKPRSTRSPITSARLGLEQLENRDLMAADMVIQWNDYLIDVIRHDSTQPGPGWASRNMAMVQAAVYDSVNAITQSHSSYVTHATAPGWASKEAAVAQSAHDVLASLYPLQKAQIDAYLTQSLATVPDGIVENAGVAIGKQVASEIVALRNQDGAASPSNYVVKNHPGHWQPDPLNPNQNALGPGWGEVKPFAIQSPQDYLAPPPPAMTSAEYAASFNEVKSLGAIDSTTRTADQTEIGVFWGYDRGGMGPPLVIYNQNIQDIATAKGNSLEQNARLFALANLAMADSAISSWHTKYVYDFWRPVTAIRQGHLDGNASTVGDPNWVPLGAPGGGVVPDFTPPFPAYTSGHATMGAAAFNVVADFFGSDKFNYTLTSDELPGVTRSYTSFSQAAEENGISRIYLGIHWNFDNIQGQVQGRRVADYVFDKFLVPLKGNQSTIGVRQDGGGFATQAIVNVPADVTLRRAGDRLQVVNNTLNQIAFSAPASKVVEARFNARDAASDILTVDWAYGGVVSLARGIRYNGNAAGGDRFWYADTQAAGNVDLHGNSLTLPGTTVALQGVTYVGIAGNGGNDRFTVRGNQAGRRIDLDGAAGNDGYVLAATGANLAIKDATGGETLNFEQATNRVKVDLALSNGQRQSIGSNNTLELRGDFEHVNGSRFDDLILGNALANTLQGRGGNDRLYGRGGNDRLLDDAGNDVLVGGLGNDVLLGGNGRDILIGGFGLDTVQGEAGENISIGSATKFDENDAALTAILAEWSSPTSQTIRRANLTNGSGSATRKNGNNFLTTTGPTPTVLNDGVVDTIIGNAATDWLIQ